MKQTIGGAPLVSVELLFEGPCLVETEILRLIVGHLGQAGVENWKVEARDVFVDFLWKQVDLKVGNGQIYVDVLIC